MRLASKSVDHGGVFDRKYTQYGDNISPHIDWSEFPAETITFILMVDDADAPGGVWNHWMVFDIPHTVTEFKENQWHGKVATNSYGEQRYLGPLPANTLPHQYEFKVYALDKRLDLSTAMNATGIMMEAQHSVIDTAVLSARYTKPDKSFGGTTENPGIQGTGEIPA